MNSEHGTQWQNVRDLADAQAGPAPLGAIREQGRRTRKRRRLMAVLVTTGLTAAVAGTAVARRWLPAPVRSLSQAGVRNWPELDVKSR